MKLNKVNFHIRLNDTTITKARYFAPTATDEEINNEFTAFINDNLEAYWSYDTEDAFEFETKEKEGN